MNMTRPPHNVEEVPGQRTVLLHYHLFKNAGTSLDRNLQANFGERWVTAEFRDGREGNTSEVESWIAETPHAFAFSSHTAQGPLPTPAGVRVLSVLFLRDPIARIRSAYRFERKQNSDSWGAQLAKQTDFEGYVKARLERPQDRQCRNFQTARLARFCPGTEPELERARTALSKITVIGLVEQFPSSMRRLSTVLAPHTPDFHWLSLQANRSAPEPGTRDREAEENAAALKLLEEANADDQALLRTARALYAPVPEERHTRPLAARYVS